jgi:hypothetical protein
MAGVFFRTISNKKLEMEFRLELAFLITHG